MDDYFAYTLTFDVNNVQCGREVPVMGQQMGNLTMRGYHLTYMVERRGDPLIHISGSASSRTACNYPVTDVDLVDTVDMLAGRAVTCVRCMAAWQLRGTIGWLHGS